MAESAFSFLEDVTVIQQIYEIIVPSRKPLYLLWRWTRKWSAPHTPVWRKALLAIQKGPGFQPS